jgi:hypothetical protein
MIDTDLAWFMLDALQEPCFLCWRQGGCQEDHLRLRVDQTAKSSHRGLKILLLVQNHMAFINNNLVELS